MSRTVRVMVVVWASVLGGVIALGDGVQTQGGPTEAPTGFGSNGFVEEFCNNQAALVDSPNSPMIPADECNEEAAVEEFTGPETPADGLGPIFNAAGCGECHLTPVLGGFSQIMEKRAGFFDGFNFTEHPGGSLIQDRSLEAGFQELATPANTNVTTFRSTLSVLGDGFVEAIANSTLQNIANNQPSAQRGQLISVPVLERPGTTRFGRFGHKNQQASLVSFSADAYKNEMGITSPLEPVENTSNGVNVEQFDLPGVDDEGVDVELFALFMRDTLAPPVNPRLVGNPDVAAGSNLFNSIGCAVCHTRTIVTAAPGTFINGGALRVANALGNKIIHPFSDFLLHDIGTGDGIVQNGGPSTRNKMRTLALWGLHTRGRFMHDASSFSLTDAVDRHRGQASTARSAFFGLSSSNRNRLITFLLSL
jgi:CxxC motif-containing protein (DUF1111 family)